MTLLHTARFAGWARGHLLCRVDGVGDGVALTFDDGPSGKTTPRILDVLARHRAHATFFTLAPNVDRWPDLARRIVAEGHELALHGELHWPLPLLTTGMIRRELERSAAAVARVTDVKPRHYRPPFGLMMPSQARAVGQMGYVAVLGDVYPEDTHRPGASEIVARVLPRLLPGSILILHDGSPLGDVDRVQTVQALELILDAMGERGLDGLSVAELLAAAPEVVEQVQMHQRGDST